MSNQEIRVKARQLYGKYFVAVLLIGLCGEGIQDILSGLLEAYYGAQVPILLTMLTQFPLIPLTVGAIGCIEPLWTSEQVQFKRLFAFYTPASRLGQSLLLGIISLAATLIVLVPSALLIMLSGLVVLYIALLIVILWLLLRLQMAVMLFASGRYTKALDALTASYQQMRGRMLDFIGMVIVILVPQVLGTTLLQALVEQNNGLWIFTALEVAFILLYVPYSMLAIQGWVLEKLNDSEQPQESENKRNQNPLFPEMKKGFEPSSRDFEDK